MHTHKQKIQDVPIVLVYKDDIKCSQGTVLFFHGLGASKDIQLHDLKNLAKYGFLVVGIDNVGHGERRFDDFEQRFSNKNPHLEHDFQQAVSQTAKEVPMIVDELYRQELIFKDRLGITGISMGGFITYRALLEEKRCKAAVSILGSPLWKNNTTTSPHLFKQQFAPTPLLSLNASKDQNVPPHYAREFHRELQDYYNDFPERLSYVEYPNSQHFMLEDDWNDLWKKMVLWFEKWLGARECHQLKIT